MAILLVIIGVIFFDLIIIAHEFGHFFTARTFGIKVNEFALGMGPKIFSIKKGETTYSLRLFPIGGFCAMEGEDEESNDPSAFGKKAAWKRFIVVIAGAIMNFILGFLITIVLLAQSPKFVSTTISEFKSGAVSSSSDLKEGDEILTVDGNKIYTSKDLLFNLTIDPKNQFDIEVKRGNEILDLKNVTFKTSLNEKGKPVIHLDFYLKSVDKNFAILMKQSYLETISTVKMVWLTLRGLVLGKLAFSSVMGPIGITSAIGQATTEGLKVSTLAAVNNIMSIMAMITINLGIINLLPLPALDGGRLILLLFEMITRKKINPKYEGWIHGAGFLILIILMIFIALNDIKTLFGWG